MKASALHIQRLVDGNAVSFPAKGEEAIVGSYTYSGKRMGGAPTLTATIYYERPLDDDWTYEEFVEFLGERFFVTSIPSSSKDNESMMYKHEIVFTSQREILDNTLFFDVVSDYDKDTQGGDRYVSNQTKFQFGGTIHEFVNRINSALAYCGLYFPQKAQGDRGYYVVVDNGYGTDDVKEISFEDEYITNVIQLINTEFELDYYWVGTVCHVGKVQHDLTDNDEDIVRYGRNDALLSISRENANTKIVDMITGRGSSDNIPEYYPNDGEFGLAVFNTANIDKEDVTVNLEKLYALDNPIGKTFTFCKIKDGQYDNTIDVYVREVWSNYQPCFKEFSQKWHIGHCDAGTRIKLSGIQCEVRYEKHQCDNLFAVVKSSYSIVVDGTRTEKVSLDDNFVCSVPGDYKFVHLVSYYVKEREQVSDGDHTGGYLNIVASIQGSLGVSCQKSDGELWFYSEGMSFRYDDGGIIFADISKAVPAICGMEYYNGFVPYGLTGEEAASKVEIKDRKFVFPSQNLMPSIYRNSGGANRFYLAENGKYEKPDGSGEFYQFSNLYKVGNPHPGSVSFDDIKPTINGVRNDVIQSDGLGQLFGEIADVAFDAKDNDIKDDSGNYTHPYFYLKLHKFSGEFGFDLFASALASDTAKINLVDSIGCPACSFEIQTHKSSDGKKFYNPVSTDAGGNLKKIDGKETGDYILSADEAASDTYNQDSRKHELWIALKKDASTLGIIMPNAANNFKPKKGEKFVITGIKAPYSLVTAAEKRLDDALIKYMFENNEDQFNIKVKFSRVFLQENPSFASRLNENSKIKVEYNGKQYELFVSSFTVKAEKSVLMEVDVELVKSLEITQSDVKNIVDAVKGETVRSLANLAGGGGSNVNMSITDKAYLSKLHDDSTKYRLTVGEFQSNGRTTIKGEAIFSPDGTFADGLTGHGARICPDGSAELDSLTLRRFLEVPELRFNRVSVHVGNQWRAPGGGIIRSVSPAADATGTALLHLEAGEIGTVAVGDICMGIYHSETAADNAEANSDDNHGNFRFAGFYTAYWEITAVEDYTDGETGQTFHNGKVSYRLRPVSANYPRQMHPTAAMHFVCYGNRTDTARQSSRYSTLTYERFLTGVSDWEFSSKQIRMQVGDLSAFSPVPGMDFSGYSVYANSIYLDGHLKQLAEMGDPNPYTYSVDNLADTLALDAKGQPKQPVVSTLADGSKSWLLHTSIQVRRGQTLLTCQEDASTTPATGQYRLLCLSVGCTAHFDHSTLYIDSVDYASRPTAYVEVTIDCEGRAALTYVFTIKVVADGDKGDQGRDGTAYGTRRRYALSARATSTSPHTPPDDVTTWQDVPLTTTEARPYLWIELTDWQQQAGGLQTFSPVSSYVRLTGDRGQRGEDGLDGKDGKSWTLRGTAFGHVTNMASLPSPAPDGIFLVDTGAEGTPVAVRQMGGAWASITTNQGDAYILAGDVWMATETTWANLGRIQGEKGDRGQAGANGRTSRIYQRLDDGQQFYDGSTITADGFCYLDFYAVPSDTAKSGWDVYRCVKSYIYQAAVHALPPSDKDHWQLVGVNADSAFFSFLIARDARIDFLQSNSIAIRKKHATAPYAGMGGDFPFWAGAAQPYPDGSGFNGSTYTFAVDEAGNLFASSAYLTGTIHATSGSIGGFVIRDGGLTNADDARNGVTITPKSITAQSSRSEEGRVVFDTQSNIVGAIGASSGKEIFWPVALQLSGRPNDSYPGTALDIVQGITRGHRPEPVLIDGSVQLVDTSDAYNVPHPLPQGSPTYSNGQRVYVRSGAVLVNIAAATVALPKNPQHGDCYLFLPCGSYNLTIDPGAHALTIDGTTFKNKTYTCAKRMVYLVFVGRGASPFGWVGKTLQ